MESSKLYRVKKEDLPRLENLLVECFSNDPLYCSLIPDQETRKRLLPELFQCDLTEFFETCEIYAESPSMNALLVVSDESEPYNPLIFYLTEAWASLRTDEYLIKEGSQLKDAVEFREGKGLLKFPLDRPAPSGGTSSCDLSGCPSFHAASWAGGPSDGRGHCVCPEPSPDGFLRDP